jgi:hypothetical protein
VNGHSLAGRLATIRTMNVERQTQRKQGRSSGPSRVRPGRASCVREGSTTAIFPQGCLSRSLRLPHRVGLKFVSTARFHSCGLRPARKIVLKSDATVAQTPKMPDQLIYGKSLATRRGDSQRS